MSADNDNARNYVFLHSHFISRHSQRFPSVGNPVGMPTRYRMPLLHAHDCEAYNTMDVSENTVSTKSTAR
jgi:hypothetical protein